MPFTWNAFAERLVWTFVSAFLGTLTGSAVLGLDLATLQVAALAGLGAVANAVTQLARYRLSVLPNPGDGLVHPGPEYPDHADHAEPDAFHAGRDVP